MKLLFTYFGLLFILQQCWKINALGECNATCPSGTYAGKFCFGCEEGNCTSLTKCSVCLPGTFNNDSGAVNCTKCPQGFYTHQNKSINCKPCDIGHYAYFRGSNSCIPCERNFIAQKNGSALCKPCLPGSYQNSRGRGTCDLCKPGFYNSYPGQDCVNCQYGYIALIAGSTKCYECPAGFYCPLPDKPPKPCPIDSYCPAGSYIAKTCTSPFWTPSKNTHCILSTEGIIMLCTGCLVGILLLITFIKLMIQLRTQWRFRIFYTWDSLKDGAPILKTKQSAPSFSGY